MTNFFDNGYEFNSKTLTNLATYMSTYEIWHTPKINLIINNKEVELENNVFDIIDNYCDQDVKERAANIKRGGYIDGFICALEAALEYIDTIEEFNDCARTLTNNDLCIIETEADNIRNNYYDYEYQYLDLSCV